MNQTLLVFLLLAAAVQIGCDDRSSSARAAPPPTPATPAPPASARPPMKEYEATPADRLGKLPAGLGVPAGEKAPDAVVHDADGKAVELAGLYRSGPVLLVFYRGGWCPFCNFEIHELSKAFPEYQRRGVQPVALSVDRADEAAKTRATYAIPFPVLSDPDLAAHKAFHVIHHADDAEVERLKSFGVDLEARAGLPHHSFAVPALFLIARDGTVKWSHADPEYKVRPKTAQILAAIDAAGFAPK